MPDNLAFPARFQQADMGAKIQLVLLAVILFLVAVRDYRTHEIPDFFQFMILLVSFLQFRPARIPGILCALPYLLVAVFGRENGIGGGDIKFAASTGVILGLPPALESSIIGLSLFLVSSLITGHCAKGKAERKEKRETARHLGPYLAAAVMVEYIMNFGG